MLLLEPTKPVSDVEITVVNGEEPDLLNPADPTAEAARTVANAIAFMGDTEPMALVELAPVNATVTPLGAD